MRRLVNLALVVMALLCCLRLTAQAEVADRIVAVVNDDVITLSELNQEGAPYFQQLIQRAPADRLQPEMEKLKREVLSHLIDQRLIDQQAAKLDIKVTDDDVNQAIDTMLNENHASQEDLKKDLAAKGMNEEQYKKQMKGQMLQSRLIGQEVRSKVVVTDEMVKKYYQEHYVAHPGAAGYHLLQMGFLWGEGTKRKTAAEAKQAAEYALKQLESGQGFAEVANVMSDLPSRTDGGDIGVFKKNELAPYMKEAVLSMKPGDTSDILETPTGYQIIKLVSEQEGGTVSAPPLAEVKKEIEAKIYKQEGEQLFKKWLDDLRAKAFIKEYL